jgi:putative NADH-flavin reductase
MNRIGDRLYAALLALLLLAGPAAASGTRIVVYGATGAIGGLITQEALRRGDTVIGVARDPSKLKIDNPQYKAVAGDVTDVASFKSITAGADAVIISVLDAASNSTPENSVSALAAKTAVAAYTGAARSPHIIQIGAAPTMMYDTRAAIEANVHMPPGNPMMGIILGHAVALETYRASTINWTVLTPPSDLQGWAMGKPPQPNRTGKYRTSVSEPVKDAAGKSAINVADLAVAAVDEAEQPHFIGKRFTVGY